MKCDHHLLWANPDEDKKKLPWYEAYNTTKHNRHSEFHQATFEHLIDACCGVQALLSAQFADEDYSLGSRPMKISRDDDEMINGLDDFLCVRYPNWPMAEQYSFVWDRLKKEADPFQDYPY